MRKMLTLGLAAAAGLAGGATVADQAPTSPAQQGPAVRAAPAASSTRAASTTAPATQQVVRGEKTYYSGVERRQRAPVWVIRKRGGSSAYAAL